MTFDPTKPVRTRDGREARIICTNKEGEWPIMVLVKSNGSELPYEVYGDGMVSKGERPSNLDLINIPERVSRFVNVYRDLGIGCDYASRKSADLYALGRKTVLEIIFEGDVPVETIIHRDV